MPDSWTEIIPPASPEEADQRFLQWKEELEARGEMLRPEDVRRDYISMGPGQGCVARYLIRNP